MSRFTSPSSGASGRWRDWLARAVDVRSDLREGTQEAACKLMHTRRIQRTAALVLRGKNVAQTQPLSMEWQQKVASNYRENIICPLRALGYRVLTLVTTYNATWPLDPKAPGSRSGGNGQTENALASVASALQSHGHIVPHLTAIDFANSSMVRAMVSSVMSLYRFMHEGPRIDFFILTRLDHLFKQPLTQLPGMRLQGAINLAFKEGDNKIWRHLGNTSASVDAFFARDARVSDAVFAFDAAWLPWFVLSLVRWVEQIEGDPFGEHKMHRFFGRLRQHVPLHNLSFLVEGFFSSRSDVPNPVFEIVPPRLSRLWLTRCASIRDFEFDPVTRRSCCAAAGAAICPPYVYRGSKR